MLFDWYVERHETITTYDSATHVTCIRDGRKACGKSMIPTGVTIPLYILLFNTVK